jgi:S1-C subfamily serine protease
VAVDGDEYWRSVGVVGAVDQLVATAYSVVAGLFDTETGAADEHSGGVVLNESGAVVGLLTVPPGGGPSGLALPIEVALAVGAQLESEGRVRHGWLGVSGTDASDRAAGGARVEEVLVGSPAETAGLGSGDLIIEVGERGAKTSVSNMAALMAQVRARPPGATLEITVLRDGQRVAIVAELGEKEPPTPPAPPAPEPPTPVPVEPAETATP